MKNTTPVTTSALLFALALTACGESDLKQLQQKEIDAARAAQQEADQIPVGGGTAAGSGTSGGAAATDGSSGGSTDNTTDGNSDSDGSTDATDTSATGSDTSGGSTDSDNSGGEPAAGQAVTSGVDLSEYQLIFNDEFNGTELDATKWNTQYVWGSDLVINGELQHYVDVLSGSSINYDPFSFDGQSLTISAIETPAEALSLAGDQPYLSGVLTSAGKFDMTYGYVEMRAQLPQGSGTWPALWMLSTEFVDLKPQMFIMEFDGGRSNSVFHNYNYHDTEGNLRSPGQREVVVEGISAGFHTYAVRWDQEELLFFVDGTPTFRIIGENVSRQAMYLIANLAVGGIWPGDPGVDTTYPIQYSIDYIRAYQRISGTGG